MITGSYLRHRKRLTIFESDEMKYTAPYFVGLITVEDREKDSSENILLNDISPKMDNLKNFLKNFFQSLLYLSVTQVR